MVEVYLLKEYIRFNMIAVYKCLFLIRYLHYTEITNWNFKIILLFTFLRDFFQMNTFQYFICSHNTWVKKLNDSLKKKLIVIFFKRMQI